MTVQFQLIGRNGRVIEASANGELAVAPLSYSTPTAQDMNAINTAFNFHKPRAGKQFVITGLIVSTSRNVGPNGANIELYEASAVDSTTVVKSVLVLDLPKQTVVPLLDVNVILNEGAFLNGKTDDAEVKVTVAGYEVNTIPNA